MSAQLEPVLRGAVARTGEQASWVGSAPSAGRTAHSVTATVASHFLFERKEEQEREIKKDGERMDLRCGWREEANGHMKLWMSYTER